MINTYSYAGKNGRSEQRNLSFIYYLGLPNNTPNMGQGGDL